MPSAAKLAEVGTIDMATESPEEEDPPEGVVVVEVEAAVPPHATRMLRPTSKQKEIYQVTLEAQLAAVDAVKPGVSCKDVDSIARNIISKAGYGKYFGHGLGHGVGMEIHEAPRLAQSGTQILKPGMVVTVEPGIYLENIGGVRIEDLIVVTETGHRILTQFPKELISLAG